MNWEIAPVVFEKPYFNRIESGYYSRGGRPMVAQYRKL